MISLVCLAITGGINILGFVKLPDIITTQITFNGGVANTMPKTYYLLGGIALSLILTLMVMKSKQKRLKWFLAQVVVTIANGVMVLIQI